MAAKLEDESYWGGYCPCVSWARNVRAQDCTVDGTELGMRLKAMRGRGGVVENVEFERISLQNILGEAIQITTFYAATTVVPRSQRPPCLRQIMLKNIYGDHNGIGTQILGLSERPLEAITLCHVTLGAREAMQCRDVRNLKLENVDFPAELCI